MDNPSTVTGATNKLNMLADFAKGSGRYRGVSLYYHEGNKPTAADVGAVPQARTINTKPLTSDDVLSAADVGAVAKTGDTMTGGLTFANAASELGWVFNTDYAKIGFKNTGDGDTDSYMWFKTGDNGNEYFKWQGVIGANTIDWMSLKSTGLVVAAGVTAPTFTGALVGNAATATKLATARQINGTDFDGSGNITTANWGTARTLTIGNSGKSVNGGTDVAWSLSEIGAVPQARTINTKPLASDIVLSAADVGAVPQARTINSKPLTSDITLSAADVGAVKQYDRFVASNAVGSDYYQCAIEVNGNTAIDSRPGIGFHMAGRFGSTLHLWEGGDFRFHTQGLGSYAGIMTGNVNANDVYIRSDRRLKKNFVEVRDALRKVSALTAYSYDKKQTLEATEYDKKEVGLIAQDVEQVLPEAVTRVVDSSNKDGTEILTLSNSALTALLVEAVKELSEKVKELEHGRT